MTQSEDDLLTLADAKWLSSSGEGREIRQAAGLSLSNVAGPTGVDTTTVWRWERGECSPRGDAAVRWARLLRLLQRSLQVSACHPTPRSVSGRASSPRRRLR